MKNSHPFIIILFLAFFIKDLIEKKILYTFIMRRISYTKAHQEAFTVDQRELHTSLVMLFFFN